MSDTPSTDAVQHGPAAGSFFAMMQHARELECALRAMVDATMAYDYATTAEVQKLAGVKMIQARNVARLLLRTDATSGDMLIQSPLGTQQLACGNRVPTENPATIRLQ